MTKPRAAIVFNPNSGRKRSASLANDFAEHWKTRIGTEVVMRPTQSYEDIRVAARETSADDIAQIFIGGDGTISECIQGLAEASDFAPLVRPFGMLPGGSGNSFLRDFGASEYPDAREAILSAVENHTHVETDVGIVSYQSFDADNPQSPGDNRKRITFNIWGLGLIPDIAALAIKMRYLGEMNYTVASIIKMITHQPLKVTMEVDGEKRDCHCNLICISNSRFTGGAMEMAPRVRINDGRLFFTSSHITSKLKLFGLFPSIFKGTHTTAPHVVTHFTDEIRFFGDEPFFWNVDGELDYGFNPHVRATRGFFRLLMPPERLQP